MKDVPLKAAVKGANLSHAMRVRLDAMRAELAERADRGDGPISTVIIVLASIAGALVIAGALAALYAKYSGKLSGQ